jgi:flagellar hook-associated protein 1 FlgK
MSLFSLFDIGKSALFASQAALNVTSHNIANVNTPGYSRKTLILEVLSPSITSGGFLGQGVRIAGIKRYYDNFIEQQLLGQYQNYGRSLAISQTLGGIEQIFNETKDIGLSKALTEYFNSWHEVATNPESQPQRIALMQKATQLIQTTKNMETNITETLKNIDESINNMIDRINDIASKISSLNKSIVYIEAGEQIEKAYDLRDQRDGLLRELSELANISYFEDKNGAITVLLGQRSLVSGGVNNNLSLDIKTDGSISINLNDTDITSLINKGQIGGLLNVKNNIETSVLLPLRKLITALIKETNLLHRSGYGLDGSTGNNFFRPLQIYTWENSSGADITANISDLSTITLDEYEITFDGSGNYTVTNKQTSSQVATGVYQSGTPILFDGIEVTITGTVTENDRFFISPIKDAIKNFGIEILDQIKIATALSSSSLPADNGNALKITGLSDANITGLGGTFDSFYRGIVSKLGTLSKASEDSLKFEQNLLTELNQRRESISGVSLDEEATNLIRFQRSYEAGARLIKITDELLETILNL